jgi:AcrR family transcriptional regulator
MRRRPTATAPPGRPFDESLTPAILAAALAELARTGFEALSLERVARRAGTAKTSLYRRWPSRDALVVDALRTFLEARGLAGAAARDEGSLRRDLIAHARRLTALLSPERAAVLAGLLLAIRTRPELAALVRALLVQEEQRAMDAILARAAGRGELAPPDVPVPVRQVLPSMILTRLLVGGGPADDAALAAIVDEVLLPLLTGRRGTGRARRPARARR